MYTGAVADVDCDAQADRLPSLKPKITTAISGKRNEEAIRTSQSDLPQVIGASFTAAATKSTAPATITNTNNTMAVASPAGKNARNLYAMGALREVAILGVGGASAGPRSASACISVSSARNTAHDRDAAARLMRVSLHSSISSARDDRAASARTEGTVGNNSVGGANRVSTARAASSRNVSVLFPNLTLANAAHTTNVPFQTHIADRDARGENSMMSSLPSCARTPRPPRHPAAANTNEQLDAPLPSAALKEQRGIFGELSTKKEPPSSGERTTPSLNTSDHNRHDAKNSMTLAENNARRDESEALANELESLGIRDDSGAERFDTPLPTTDDTNTSSAHAPSSSYHQHSLCGGKREDVCEPGVALPPSPLLPLSEERSEAPLMKSDEIQSEKGGVNTENAKDRDVRRSRRRRPTSTPSHTHYSTPPLESIAVASPLHPLASSDGDIDENHSDEVTAEALLSSSQQQALKLRDACEYTMPFMTSMMDSNSASAWGAPDASGEGKGIGIDDSSCGPASSGVSASGLPLSSRTRSHRIPRPPLPLGPSSSSLFSNNNVILIDMDSNTAKKTNKNNPRGCAAAAAVRKANGGGRDGVSNNGALPRPIFIFDETGGASQEPIFRCEASSSSSSSSSHSSSHRGVQSGDFAYSRSSDHAANPLLSFNTHSHTSGGEDISSTSPYTSNANISEPVATSSSVLILNEHTDVRQVENTSMLVGSGLDVAVGADDANKRSAFVRVPTPPPQPKLNSIVFPFFASIVEPSYYAERPRTSRGPSPPSSHLMNATSPSPTPALVTIQSITPLSLSQPTAEAPRVHVESAGDVVELKKLKREEEEKLDQNNNEHRPQHEKKALETDQTGERELSTPPTLHEEDGRSGNDERLHHTSDNQSAPRDSSHENKYDEMMNTKGEATSTHFKHTEHLVGDEAVVEDRTEHYGSAAEENGQSVTLEELHFSPSPPSKRRVVSEEDIHVGKQESTLNPRPLAADVDGDVKEADSSASPPPPSSSSSPIDFFPQQCGDSANRDNDDTPRTQEGLEEDDNSSSPHENECPLSADDPDVENFHLHQQEHHGTHDGQEQQAQGVVGRHYCGLNTFKDGDDDHYTETPKKEREGERGGEEETFYSYSFGEGTTASEQNVKKNARGRIDSGGNTPTCATVGCHNSSEKTLFGQTQFDEYDRYDDAKEYSYDDNRADDDDYEAEGGTPMLVPVYLPNIDNTVDDRACRGYDLGHDFYFNPTINFTAVHESKRLLGDVRTLMKLLASGHMYESTGHFTYPSSISSMSGERAEVASAQQFIDNITNVPELLHVLRWIKPPTHRISTAPLVMSESSFAEAAAASATDSTYKTFTGTSTTCSCNDADASIPTSVSLSLLQSLLKLPRAIHSDDIFKERVLELRTTRDHLREVRLLEALEGINRYELVNARRLPSVEELREQHGILVDYVVADELEDDHDNDGEEDEGNSAFSSTTNSNIEESQRRQAKASGSKEKTRRRRRRRMRRGGRINTMRSLPMDDSFIDLSLSKTVFFFGDVHKKGGFRFPEKDKKGKDNLGRGGNEHDFFVNLFAKTAFENRLAAVSSFDLLLVTNGGGAAAAACGGGNSNLWSGGTADNIADQNTTATFFSPPSAVLRAPLGGMGHTATKASKARDDELGAGKGVAVLALLLRLVDVFISALDAFRGSEKNQSKTASRGALDGVAKPHQPTVGYGGEEVDDEGMRDSFAASSRHSFSSLSSSSLSPSSEIVIAVRNTFWAQLSDDGLRGKPTTKICVVRDDAVYSSSSSEPCLSDEEDEEAADVTSSIVDRIAESLEDWWRCRTSRLALFCGGGDEEEKTIAAIADLILNGCVEETGAVPSDERNDFSDDASHERGFECSCTSSSAPSSLSHPLTSPYSTIGKASMRLAKAITRLDALLLAKDMQQFSKSPTSTALSVGVEEKEEINNKSIYDEIGFKRTNVAPHVRAMLGLHSHLLMNCWAALLAVASERLPLIPIAGALVRGMSASASVVEERIELLLSLKLEADERQRAVLTFIPSFVPSSDQMRSDSNTENMHSHNGASRNSGATEELTTEKPVTPSNPLLPTVKEEEEVATDIIPSFIVSNDPKKYAFSSRKGAHTEVEKKRVDETEEGVMNANVSLFTLHEKEQKCPFELIAETAANESEQKDDNNGKGDGEELKGVEETHDIAINTNSAAEAKGVINEAAVDDRPLSTLSAAPKPLDAQFQTELLNTSTENNKFGHEYEIQQAAVEDTSKNKNDEIPDVIVIRHDLARAATAQRWRDGNYTNKRNVLEKEKGKRGHDNASVDIISELVAKRDASVGTAAYALSVATGLAQNAIPLARDRYASSSAVESHRQHNDKLLSGALHNAEKRQQQQMEKEEAEMNRRRERGDEAEGAWLSSSSPRHSRRHEGNGEDGGATSDDDDSDSDDTKAKKKPQQDDQRLVLINNNVASSQLLAAGAIVEASAFIHAFELRRKAKSTHITSDSAFSSSSSVPHPYADDPSIEPQSTQCDEGQSMAAINNNRQKVKHYRDNNYERSDLENEEEVEEKVLERLAEFIPSPVSYAPIRLLHPITAAHYDDTLDIATADCFLANDQQRPIRRFRGGRNRAVTSTNTKGGGGTSMATAHDNDNFNSEARGRGRMHKNTSRTINNKNNTVDYAASAAHHKYRAGRNGSLAMVDDGESLRRGSTIFPPSQRANRNISNRTQTAEGTNHQMRRTVQGRRNTNGSRHHSTTTATATNATSSAVGLRRRSRRGLRGGRRASSSSATAASSSSSVGGDTQRDESDLTNGLVEEEANNSSGGGVYYTYEETDEEEEEDGDDEYTYSDEETNDGDDDDDGDEEGDEHRQHQYYEGHHEDSAAEYDDEDEDDDEAEEEYTIEVDTATVAADSPTDSSFLQE